MAYSLSHKQHPPHNNILEQQVVLCNAGGTDNLPTEKEEKFKILLQLATLTTWFVYSYSTSSNYCETKLNDYGSNLIIDMNTILSGEVIVRYKNYRTDDVRYNFIFLDDSFLFIIRYYNIKIFLIYFAATQKNESE